MKRIWGQRPKKPTKTEILADAIRSWTAQGDDLKRPLELWVPLATRLREWSEQTAQESLKNALAARPPLPPELFFKKWWRKAASDKLGFASLRSKKAATAKKPAPEAEWRWAPLEEIEKAWARDIRIEKSERREIKNFLALNALTSAVSVGWSRKNQQLSPETLAAWAVCVYAGQHAPHAKDAGEMSDLPAFDWLLPVFKRDLGLPDDFEAGSWRKKDIALTPAQAFVRHVEKTGAFFVHGCSYERGPISYDNKEGSDILMAKALREAERWEIGEGAGIGLRAKDARKSPRAIGRPPKRL